MRCDRDGRTWYYASTEKIGQDTGLDRKRSEWEWEPLEIKVIVHVHHDLFCYILVTSWKPMKHDKARLRLARLRQCEVETSGIITSSFQHSSPVLEIKDWWKRRKFGRAKSAACCAESSSHIRIAIGQSSWTIWSTSTMSSSIATLSWLWASCPLGRSRTSWTPPRPDSQKLATISYPVQRHRRQLQAIVLIQLCQLRHLHLESQFR